MAKFPSIEDLKNNDDERAFTETYSTYSSVRIKIELIAKHLGVKKSEAHRKLINKFFELNKDEIIQSKAHESEKE